MRKSIVIIPAYNVEKSIHEVVTGAHKYTDVSVTNDASTDGTVDILSEIDQEVGDCEAPSQVACG